jgi:hypothetical protein
MGCAGTSDERALRKRKGCIRLARELLVERSMPEGSTSRVYGSVYSGLDIGQAPSPLLFCVLLGLAVIQGG